MDGNSENRRDIQICTLQQAPKHCALCHGLPGNETPRLPFRIFPGKTRLFCPIHHDTLLDPRNPADLPVNSRCVQYWSRIADSRPENCRSLQVLRHFRSLSIQQILTPALVSSEILPWSCVLAPKPNSPRKPSVAANAAASSAPRYAAKPATLRSKLQQPTAPACSPRHSTKQALRPHSQPRGSTGHGWCCAPVVMRPGEIPGDDCDDRQDSCDANGPPGSLVTRRASLTALTSRPRSHTPRKSRTKSDARTPKALLYTARPADTHQNRAGPTHRGHTSERAATTGTHTGLTGDTRCSAQPRRGHTPGDGRASAATGDTPRTGRPHKPAPHTGDTHRGHTPGDTHRITDAHQPRRGHTPGPGGPHSPGTLTGHKHRGTHTGRRTGVSRDGGHTGIGRAPHTGGHTPGDTHRGHSPGILTGDTHRGHSPGSHDGDTHRGHSPGTGQAPGTGTGDTNRGDTHGGHTSERGRAPATTGTQTGDTRRSADGTSHHGGHTPNHGRASAATGDTPRTGRPHKPAPHTGDTHRGHTSERGRAPATTGTHTGI